jgi:hypothetical protein
MVKKSDREAKKEQRIGEGKNLVLVLGQNANE